MNLGGVVVCSSIKQNRKISGQEHLEMNILREMKAYAYWRQRRHSLQKFFPAYRGGGGVSSCIEFGANIGLNLMALRRLLPTLEISAVEINAEAAARCAEIPEAHVYNSSLFDFASDETYDMTFMSGVLIHINPDKLNEVYDLLYRYSKRYILINEYYNPIPVEVNYRGFSDRLFKRDFAGEFMDRFPDVRLLNYGFQYHRDKNFPMDDLTWFLMEK